MIREALANARDKRATDVVVREVFGTYFKIDGDNTDILYPADPHAITRFLSDHGLDAESLVAQRRTWGFGIEDPRFGRVRAQLARDHLGYSLSMRLIPSSPFPLVFFGLPDDVVSSLTAAFRGLVLFVGEKGCGKSSLWQTLSSEIYAPQCRDQVILEDPIEMPFRHPLTQQFEVGDHDFAHLQSFAEGGRHSLRANSMVVIIGEIRDVETARAALQLAESGALVLATLHAPRTVDTPERLLAFFDAAERALARVQLAQTLYAIVGPRLARLTKPLEDGRRRTMVVEYLPGDDDVRHAILTADTKTLTDYLLGPPRTAVNRDIQRPHLLEDAIANLVYHQMVSDEEVRRIANDVQAVRDHCGALV